jgi:hypothetical protein
MELNEFIRHAMRRWYIIAVLLLIGIAGVLMYHNLTGTKKAEATVAVLGSRIAAPGEYVPPQITFEALDESRELSQRVASSLGDGSTAESIQNAINIEFKISQTVSLTPLYTVTAKDTDEERAKRIADVTLSEAIKLYGEINQPDPVDIRAAYQPEVTRLEDEAKAARDAVNRFETENDAIGLGARRDQIVGFVTQLRVASAAGGSAAASQGSVLSAAQAELNRLTGLEGEYTRLRTDATLAAAELARAETRMSDLKVSTQAYTANGLEQGYVQPFLDAAQNELNLATSRNKATQEALAQFQRTHNVVDVTASRQAQQNVVNQYSASGSAASISSASVATALAQQEAELRRLEALRTEWLELNLRLQRAEAHLSSLQQSILDITTGRALPAEAQVLVLDDATIQSNLFWLIVTYGLGVIVSTFVAFTIIYVLGVLEGSAPTTGQIEGRFGVPVLAHVPRSPENGRGDDL